MSSPAELYVEGIKEKLENYYAAWLPGEKLKLGDVGVLEGKFFKRLTTLGECGITFEERPDPDPTPIDYISQSGVTFAIKAEGETSADLPRIPQAKAGIGFKFSKEGAFAVVAPKTYEPSIENIVKLEQDILEALAEGRWREDWVVIVKIVNAPTATILISRSSSSELQIAASAELDKGLVDLGSGSIDFSIRWQSGDVLKMIGAEHVSPFFQLAGIESGGFLGLGDDELVIKSFAQPAVAAPRKKLTPKLIAERPELLTKLRLGIVPG